MKGFDIPNEYKLTPGIHLLGYHQQAIFNSTD
jgi:hypothetical protein